VSAYRKAGDTVEDFPGSLRELFAYKGTAGLHALRGIGPELALRFHDTLEQEAKASRPASLTHAGDPAAVEWGLYTGRPFIDKYSPRGAGWL
jgi:hypothetical protein